MSITRIESGQRMSQVVAFNGVVHLSGQVAQDGSVDVAAQTRQVLESIDRLLGLAGTNRNRLLTAQIYLADIADFDAMNTVWEAWVSRGNAPTRATVEARLASPDLKVEIVVSAAV